MDAIGFRRVSERWEYYSYDTHSIMKKGYRETLIDKAYWQESVMNIFAVQSFFHKLIISITVFSEFLVFISESSCEIVISSTSTIFFFFFFFFCHRRGFHICMLYDHALGGALLAVGSLVPVCNCSR